MQAAVTVLTDALSQLFNLVNEFVTCHPIYVFVHICSSGVRSDEFI